MALHGPLDKLMSANKPFERVAAPWLLKSLKEGRFIVLCRRFVVRRISFWATTGHTKAGSRSTVAAVVRSRFRAHAENAVGLVDIIIPLSVCPSHSDFVAHRSLRMARFNLLELAQRDVDDLDGVGRHIVFGCDLHH
jgi:hypothetical protein